MPATPQPNLRRSKPFWGLCLLAGLAIAAVAWGYAQTAPVRGAVRTFYLVTQAANQGDIEGATHLCSSQFLARYPLEIADEGGLKFLPRNIHKNFAAWRQGPNVWLCPTNRVGPVFQLVPQGSDWLFDGPVGELLPGRELVLFDP